MEPCLIDVHDFHKPCLTPHHSRKETSKSGNSLLIVSSFFEQFERIAVETADRWHPGKAVSHLVELVMTKCGKNRVSFASFASKVW